MVCLDTDFLIELARKDAKARARIEQLEDSGELIYTTTVNMAEFYSGVHRSKGGWSEDHARQFLESFATLTLDHESARIWGKLSAQLKSSTIGDSDLFIASIALANKQAILTRNVRHFERVSGLKVESW